MTQAALGVAFAAAIAAVAYRAGALSSGGAVAACFVGAIVFATTGWSGAAVLFAFFIPASALSRVGYRRKRELAEIEKHGPRDGWQVLANGGVAALCALAAARGNAAFAAGFA
ncbi:MAG: DUF92 domain-containing protein, partial [Candidatus Baltobacteraceae bacterium]